eukprot:scaffold15728_cov132-Skeletonema_menzelii.AAC.3
MPSSTRPRQATQPWPHAAPLLKETKLIAELSIDTWLIVTIDNYVDNGALASAKSTERRKNGGNMRRRCSAGNGY